MLQRRLSFLIANALMVLGALGPRSFVMAQAQALTEPSFEVASVKANRSGELRASMGVQPGGRFSATNIPARTIISYAYQLQEYQVLDGPSWLDADRFDVIARAAENQALVPPVPGGPPSTIQLMVRALLAERFSLVAHSETRELPVYHLVPARADRALGPRIRQSRADCSAPRPAATRGDPQPACGIQLTLGALSTGGRTLAELSGILSQFVQRPVDDRTGMAGTFDVELTWTPDVTPNMPSESISPFDPDRPTLFTALQEQLGLRLQAARGPVAALVIDRAERPSPD